MKVTITIPRHLIEKFLIRMLPRANEASDLFKQNAEDDGLPPRLREWIERHRVKSWAEAYEESDSYYGLQAGVANLQATLPTQIEIDPGKTQEEIVQGWFDEYWQNLEQHLDDDSDDFAFMDAEEPQVMEELGLDDDGQPITRQQFFMTAALVVVFNHFAFMAHRKSMYQLVAQAETGVEAAFLKAVQIDRSCLTDIPYFREKVIAAMQQGNYKFLQRVAKYQQKPISQSGTEYRALYLSLAMLDSMHMLDAFTADQAKFAAFCQSEGIYGSGDDSEDVVDSLMRAIRRFKSQYQSLAKPLSSKIKLVVKDTN